MRLSNELAKLDIPVKLLIDSAVAYSMDEVDMVFVGADGVVESGGIINMMGTYQIALVAKSMNKPMYVAAESYKVRQAIVLFVNFEIILVHTEMKLRYSSFLGALHPYLQPYNAIIQHLRSLGIIVAKAFSFLDLCCCSLLGSIRWIKKTWSQRYVQLILGSPYLPRLKLKHLLVTIHHLNILPYSLQIWVF